MTRLFRFKCHFLSACFAAACLSLFASTVAAQGRGGFGQGGRNFDPARREEFFKRMQAGQGAKPEEEKKPDGEKGEKKDDQPKSEAKEPPKDEGPPPVQRPLRPRREANPSELDAAPDEKGKISFSFKGQPWPSVLEWLADVSHMSLQWEEAPAGYLDLTTRGKYTVDEVRDLLNSVLLAKGFTLLRNGEVLIVANLKKLDPGFVPRVSIDELDERGNYEPVKVFFDLDWLVAENAVEEVKPLLSSFGKATALKATNRLDVLDTAGNLRRIRELLAEEQSDTGQQRLVREFKLRHTRAAEVLETLNTLLGIEPKGASGQANPQQMFQAMQQMGGGRGGRGRGPGGGGGGDAGEGAGPGGGGEGMAAMQQQQQPRKESPVYLVVNRRENSILANAPPDKMAVIEQAILAIDVMHDHEGGSLMGNVQRMQVYRLAGISPESLVNVLEELGGLDPTTKLEIDAKSRALIAYAPLIDHVMIRALVERLDGTARRFEVVPLRMLSAEYVAGSIMTLMQGPEKPAQASDPWSRRFGSVDASPQNENFDKFWVEADIERNRLLLRANDFELAEVKALLVKLGEIPPSERNLNTMRIVPVAPGDEADRFLERLKQLWPSVAPNPLEVDAGDSRGVEGKPKQRRRTDERRPEAPDARRLKPPAERATDARGDRRDPRYRLAQERRVSRDEASRPAAQVPRVEPEAEDDDAARGDVEAGDDLPVDDALIAEDAPTVDGALKAEDDDATSAGEDGAPAADEAQTAEENATEMEPTDNEAKFDDRVLPPEAHAPVKITMGPQGLVISSSDTEALDRLEELLTSLLPPSRLTYKIFTLEHTYAKDVVLLLKDVFKDDADKSGSSSLQAFDLMWNGRSPTPQKSRTTLGKRKALSFVADPVTNTILVQGADATQLDEIKELIEFYDRAEPPNSESVRHTQRVALRYAKAKEVAEVVKDVFRDLLSPNDKALIANMPPQPPQQRQQSENFYTSMMSYLSDDPSKSAAVPRFKGMLSVGIDERANGVIVSAPRVLLTQVLVMVKDLDAAARSTRPVVKLLRVNGDRTRALIQQAIAPKKSETTAAEAAGQANVGQAAGSKPMGGRQGNGQSSAGP